MTIVQLFFDKVYLVFCKVSPPAALETQRTQSRFFFSLSGERPESEKQQRPAGKKALKGLIDAHRSTSAIQIPPRSGCGFSFAALPVHQSVWRISGK
jgi:hypothetical protein